MIDNASYLSAAGLNTAGSENTDNTTVPSEEVRPAALRVRVAAPYIGVSIPTFWRFAKEDPTFPQPVKIGANTTVFMREELEVWLESKKGEGYE